MNIINKITGIFMFYIHFSKDMNNIDWFLYDVSDISLIVLWTILLLITKKIPNDGVFYIYICINYI